MATRPAELLKWSLVGVIGLFALVYVGDLLWLRYRMAYSNEAAAFGTVQMDRLYAIPQKNGKTEYEFDVQQPQVNVRCVRSLLPQLRYSPCWYLQRNSHKPIPMVIMPLTRP